jgi:hypothetical protein
LLDDFVEDILSAHQLHACNPLSESKIKKHNLREYRSVNGSYKPWSLKSGCKKD